MSLVLLGLKVTFHLAAHSFIFNKSLLNCSLVSVVFGPEAKSVVSSANIIISLSMSLQISFISTIQKSLMSVTQKFVRPSVRPCVCEPLKQYGHESHDVMKVMMSCKS